MPDLLDELDRTLATIDVAAARRRPGRCGSAAWAGGDRDGNPNVTPAVTLDGPRPAARRRPRRARRAARGPAHRAVASTRFVEVTDALRESLERDAEALPITYDAVRRLNAEEPYRLKLSFVRVRLQRTRDRLAHGTPHEPGRDYATFDELLDDLTLIRDSMLAGGDRLTADGAILRLIRTRGAIGHGPGHPRHP